MLFIFLIIKAGDFLDIKHTKLRAVGIRFKQHEILLGIPTSHDIQTSVIRDMDQAETDD